MGKMMVQFEDDEGKRVCLADELRQAEERLKAGGDSSARRALRRRKLRWEQSMSAFFADIRAAGKEALGDDEWKKQLLK